MSQSGIKRKNPISGQFSPRLIEMLEAPAWRVLSLSARRVIERIEIELAHHGGRDNGGLTVTYDDFHHYGIDRHAICPAIREAEALGFIEVTERGRAGNAQECAPNTFRLTYRPCKGLPSGRDGTHEWRRVKTVEDAEAVAKAARSGVRRKTIPSGGKRTPPVGETPTENPNPQWGKPPLLSSGGNPHHCLYFRGGGGGCGGQSSASPSVARLPRRGGPGGGAV